MPPKKDLPPPIDRPLSKAYLRQFVGWSTAFPPGQSEPNSLRLMENVFVDRNGALQVRAGLKHLTYTVTPGLDPLIHDNPGTGIGLQVVGSPEVFYLNDGSRAMLFAVREAGGGVGFRVCVSNRVSKVVYDLTDPEIGFAVPQGTDILNFSDDTTHVEYLQINNRILALSDNGEPARLFYVGGQKLAKRLKAISVPTWDDAQKPTVFHPDAAWISSLSHTTRTNTALNPSFEIGTMFWKKSDNALWKVVDDTGQQGGKALEVEAAPYWTNMQPSSLGNPAVEGFESWQPGLGNPLLAATGPYLQVSPREPGEVLAEGPRIIYGVESDAQYRVALDYDYDMGAQPYIFLEFYSNDGLLLSTRTIDVEGAGGRWASPAISASTGATSMRLQIGARSEGGIFSVRYKHIQVCADGEPTTWFNGYSGANYFWTGAHLQSASVYQPPQDIWIKSSTYAIPSGATNMAGSIAIKKMQSDATVTQVQLRMYTVDAFTPTQGGEQEDSPGSTAQVSPTTSWARYGTSAPLSGTPGAVSSEIHIIFEQVVRGQKFRLDGALMESGTSSTNNYFDGSKPSTVSYMYEWAGTGSKLPHEGISIEHAYGLFQARVAETPTANTLVKTGGATANPYKMAFFYTFENDIGESAPSKITEIRMQRPWSNWIWETPNAAGEPSGTYTPNAEMVADQLVVQMPQNVYQQAVLEGALRWNIYAFSWSDQSPVPVVAQLIASKDIIPDQATPGSTPLPYELAGWMQITPSRKAGTDDTLLPTMENRVNSSLPPQHRNGIVAGDRMVLIGSPVQPATIHWSSSSPGRYTMFTPNRGGGAKTLTSGNLNLPFSVVLWQNPQSVDTLTILCSDDNGRTTSYYMQPATVNAGNTGVQSIMGFEETTSTPGTVAPYGAEVLNNALYRPLDRFLMKSTASNYNINHKTMTDKIANMWQLLESKDWIMSAQLDNRLFYLVHNPRGEALRPGCKGNEIWLFDVAAENGHWSRLLIQGSSVKPVNVGAVTYMCISTDTGLYYLDMNARQDDYADLENKIYKRKIPWQFETNTQGANKAHDAWAHLQQVGVIFGNWQGSAVYGVRGHSVHGMPILQSKVFTDTRIGLPPGQTWDVEDVLLIRQDMKEWYFFAGSSGDDGGTGQIGIIQYRYTPVSVNVGYEFGSIETFEYGADAGTDGTEYSRNGIPLPYIDYARP